MLEPINKNFYLYKGADFNLRFRLYKNGIAADFTGKQLTFKAVDSVTGTLAINKSLTGSPSGITYDSATGVVQMRLAHTATAAITNTRLIYELELQNDAGGYDRVMQGAIECYAGIA